MGEPKKGTILARNKEGTLEASALLWRALTSDKPETMRKYITKDAVLAEPDRKVYSPKTEPTLDEYIEEDYEPWTAYKIHGEPEFVEIDMMASALTYRVTAWKLKGGEMVATEGWCSSVFRQGPGGDWRCCCHHMAKI
ncbi:hypothetical protein FSOLCH5_001877 [Fusarium solani]|jgi:ketosteroid isomerase-like protein|uniref:DUF4440 domain-containing protein n=1 Tax=Fusarium solani TaxID=169388 RepID=A0A9P9JVL7_FUSSL|nr:uncharacterized protein B0J15DRAFT_504778 [Fusarium solani]KAH7234075.1 hypothetical protein B0J15DRAFT_504778 [Fusarium solani]KAJ3471782.1 hypothetical protein MRS44_001881 [Fusarium solani]KAJ4217132.1 hypothetical protein NW759_009078 [Fusarium solani]